MYCLYLKNCNCDFDLDDKIHICYTKLGMEELSKIRICLYGTTSRVEYHFTGQSGSNFSTQHSLTREARSM